MLPADRLRRTRLRRMLPADRLRRTRLRRMLPADRLRRTRRMLSEGALPPASGEHPIDQFKWPLTHNGCQA
jgi:hypothetical protein